MGNLCCPEDTIVDRVSTSSASDLSKPIAYVMPEYCQVEQ